MCCILQVLITLFTNPTFFSSTVHCVWNSNKAYFVSHTTYFPWVVKSLHEYSLLQHYRAIYSYSAYLDQTWDCHARSRLNMDWEMKLCSSHYFCLWSQINSTVTLILLYAFVSEILMQSFTWCLKNMWQVNTRSHCPCVESEHEPTLIQKGCEHVSDHNSSAVQILASQCQFLGFCWASMSLSLCYRLQLE